MESEIIAQEYSLTWKDHTQHVRESFTKLLQSSDFCDVTLYAEGQKIGAHKAFLTACSAYFNQLFEDFKEERPIVVLKGIQFNILQHILKFIYNGEVSIDIHKLSEFLEAAEFLKIFGLIKEKTYKQECMGEAEHSCNTEEIQSCKCGEMEVLTQDLSSDSKLKPQGDINGISNELKRNSGDNDNRKKVCNKKKKEAVQRLYRIDILSTKNVVSDSSHEATEELPEVKSSSDNEVNIFLEDKLPDIQTQNNTDSQCSLKRRNNPSVDSLERRASTKEKRRSQRMSSNQNNVNNAQRNTEARRASDEESHSSQKSSLSNQSDVNSSDDIDAVIENGNSRDSDLEANSSPYTSSRQSDVIKFGYYPRVINKNLIEEPKKCLTENGLEIEPLGSIDEEDLNCDMCNKMYGQKKDYNSKPPLTCMICGLSVQLKSQMESHLKNHGIL